MFPRKKDSLFKKKNTLKALNTPPIFIGIQLMKILREEDTWDQGVYKQQVNKVIILIMSNNDRRCCFLVKR